MRSISLIFSRFGDPLEVVSCVSRDIPPLGVGELLVRMKARPINPSDLIPIRGSYAHRIGLPCIPGYEGVGIVEDVGAHVSPSLLGQRVLPLRGEGTWQQQCITPADWAVPVPDWLDDETASQLFINPVTALLLCTDILHLQPGDWVIVNAGGSAIGRILAQLSIVFGFRLISVTRDDSHTAELLELGSQHVINSSDASVRERVMDVTAGRGAAAAIDSVGGASSLELLGCTRSGGTVLSIGLLSGEPVNLSEHVRDTGVIIRLFHLRHWMQGVTVARWQETFQTLFRLIRGNQLRLPAVRERFELHHFRQAIVAAEQKGRPGKVLLV